MFNGDTTAFAASRKQKYVTKSPTESELVGLMDNVSFIEYLKKFFILL